MIGYLHGQVQSVQEHSLIIQTGGVGYLVYITTTLQKIAVEGSEMSVYIHTVVREQSLDLYGFADEREKEIFTLLMTISGIGPKVALGILNTATVAHLVQAIHQKDSSLLTKVSGIGTKNAEKIILELGNKVDPSWLADYSELSNEEVEVFEALEALGYRSRDIQNTLKDSAIQTLEGSEKIRAAMQLLGR